MKILRKRNRLQQVLFYVRWQLWPVAIALPGHLRFVVRGFGAAIGAPKRVGLALRMCRIHLSLECGHAPLELLTIAEDIISLPPSIPGAVVECGTWLGGSTSKLSLACAAVGRPLFACDSFQGLPDLSDVDRLEGKEPFSRGDFTTQLDVVRENVRRLGDLPTVTFVAGWYSDTLGQLPVERIACAFVDVDLKSSIEDSVRGLWTRLSPGAKLFVHDVDRPGVTEPFADAAFWSEQMKSPPPRFIGASIGMGPLRPLLGYAEKA
jgi:hypothetical protein